MKGTLTIDIPATCRACPLHQASDTGVAIYCGPLSTPRTPAIVGASHADDDSGYVGYVARHAGCPLVPAEPEAAL